MKYMSLLGLALLASINYLTAMNPNEDLNLSDAEKNCYEWFSKHQKTLPIFFQNLSQEDRDVFNL